MSVPRVVKRLPLRGGPDVVMHDERRRLLYVAIGRDPTSGQPRAFAPQRGGGLVFGET